MTSRDDAPRIGSTVSIQRRPLGAMKRRRPNHWSASNQHCRSTRQESPSISRSRRLIASPDGPGPVAFPLRFWTFVGDAVCGGDRGGRGRGNLTVPSQRQVVHQRFWSFWCLRKRERVFNQRERICRVSVPQSGQIGDRGRVR